MSKVIALLIGKANSTGMPGKNWMELQGMPSCEYGFNAGKSDPRISNHFVSTDSIDIANIGAKYNYKHIKRPENLAMPESLTEDALVHAHLKIKEETDYDIMVLLFANNPAINKKLLKEAITKIENDKSIDSVFSVCKYNMFSPTRARKIENDTIQPFISLDNFEDVSSIRSSQGDVYFCDLSIQVIRARVFDNIEKGKLPFKWQGEKSVPVYNNFGFDIDEAWQKITIEYWISKFWEK